MNTTPHQHKAPLPQASVSDDGNDGTNELPITVKPGATVTMANTVEDAVRTLEEGPTEGFVILDATILREASKSFLRRNRIATRDMIDEVVPIFTPEHLNILFGDLTRAQQTFLLLLLRDPGAFVSRGELLRAIRGNNGKESRSHSLNQLACVLRKKLGRNGAGRCIETVHGTGFRWNREKESKALSFEFFKIADLAMLSALAIAAGINLYASRDSERSGGTDTSSIGDDALASTRVQSGTSGSVASASDEPFQAMRRFSNLDSFGKPFSSIQSAKGHSPWRMVAGNEGTWFEGGGPARAGDCVSFHLPTPINTGVAGEPVRRIEILCGPPDAVGPSSVPPCRVECSADLSEAPGSWHPVGAIDPATGQFSMDVENLPLHSVSAIRIVVTADSDLPLVVREAKMKEP